MSSPVTLSSPVQTCSLSSPIRPRSISPGHRSLPAARKAFRLRLISTISSGPGSSQVRGVLLSRAVEDEEAWCRSRDLEAGPGASWNCPPGLLNRAKRRYSGVALHEGMVLLFGLRDLRAASAALSVCCGDQPRSLGRARSPSPLHARPGPHLRFGCDPPRAVIQRQRTAPANALLSLLSRIHDRMPAILAPTSTGGSGRSRNCMRPFHRNASPQRGRQRPLALSGPWASRAVCGGVVQQRAGASEGGHAGKRGPGRRWLGPTDGAGRAARLSGPPRPWHAINAWCRFPR
jgi:hypothetical protein